VIGLFDSTIIPDSHNPAAGDVWTRSVVSSAMGPLSLQADERRSPSSLVIHEVRAGDLPQYVSHRIIAYVDGHQRAFDDAFELRVWLTSANMQPVGRVASGEPPLSDDRRELDNVRRHLDDALAPWGHTPDPTQTVTSLAAAVVSKLVETNTHERDL
jgi:hypothetical protein